MSWASEACVSFTGVVPTKDFISQCSGGRRHHASSCNQARHQCAKSSASLARGDTRIAPCSTFIIGTAIGTCMIWVRHHTLCDIKLLRDAFARGQTRHCGSLPYARMSPLGSPTVQTEARCWYVVYGSAFLRSSAISETDRIAVTVPAPLGAEWTVLQTMLLHVHPVQSESSDLA